MIDIHIIDHSDKIKQSISSKDSNITLHGDEVKALNAVEIKQPTIVLLNYDIRKDDMANYIRLILQMSPNSKVVIIANKLAEKKIINCLLAGAKGYQEMQQLDFYASKLISVIAKGEAWITRRMVSTLLDTIRKS